MDGESVDNERGATARLAGPETRFDLATVGPIPGRIFSFLGRITGSPALPLSACPSCGTAGLRRSRVRFYEAWRKMLSPNRPFRCQACWRRVWGRHARIEAPLIWETLPLPESLPADPVDLSEIDRTLGGEAAGATNETGFPLFEEGAARSPGSTVHARPIRSRRKRRQRAG